MDHFILTTDNPQQPDNIPRYVSNALSTKSSSANGFWDDTSKWSDTAVPGTSDLVIVDDEITIRNTSAIASAIEIRPGGKLIFDPSVNTKLLVGTLTILPNGLLQIGTSGTAINASKKADSILIKYTYYGDADLSGVIDGTDYSLIDNGFNSAYAGNNGWFNGDFDYSHLIDGTDYALIDNAFNNQWAAVVGSTMA